MDEYRFSTHVCDDAATDSLVAPILEGLGSNIQKQTGINQLGRSVRIFIRDRHDNVVGGILADLFGGWAYISLLWIAETMASRHYRPKAPGAQVPPGGRDPPPWLRTTRGIP